MKKKQRIRPLTPPQIEQLKTLAHLSSDRIAEEMSLSPAIARRFLREHGIFGKRTLKHGIHVGADSEIDYKKLKELCRKRGSTLSTITNEINAGRGLGTGLSRISRYRVKAACVFVGYKSIKDDEGYL